MLITADRVALPDRLLEPGWVTVEGDRIAEVGEGRPRATADLDLPGHTLAPGFVDAHCHGGGGHAFTDGPEAARAAVAAHLRSGTTSTMASLVTESVAGLAGQVAALAPLVAAGELVGVHLEGPWLSPARAGAHDPALLGAPERAAVEQVLDAAPGAVRMVTLAPELPGALEAVALLRERGSVVAAGHTQATYDQTVAAIDAGVTVATHLMNAMRAPHQREPGPAVALLESDQVYVELIADGVHLHPAVVRSVARARPDRVVLVTDAMAAAGAADGDYTLGGLAVQVRDGEARLADGTIAGSTLTMAQAVRYAVQVAGVPLLVALRAATASPAAMLGLADVGRLAPGAWADLVALDAALQVTEVVHGGRLRGRA
ncbi:N-acetylglucosamine-6-phosphate deacetylase [Nocardioides campestrisoli]|uniref:N-acetylglucosamine-6-phosphate deacetylase n=1 Tax=Nocardioides campestrisoli TaxID=2736757 RepID=UPI0015E6D252|nr:N-acetylglucosamine-6-phosphate deacetylase [Nocardioides campestrisoli]